MSAVASSKEHIDSTKRIIIHKVGQLCSVMKNIHDLQPKPSDAEIVAYLTRMVEVKIELHAIVDVFPDVDWAAVDEAMSSAYKPLESN